MERVCEKCGSLVSGDVKFCPSCGAPMQSAVDLGKPETSPQPIQPNYGYTNMSNNGYGMPQYGPNINQGGVPQQAMTTGQWVGTILLCTCLGIISLILNIVWGFSSSTPEPKRGFCRGMFFAELILMGISIILCIILVVFFLPVIKDLIESSNDPILHFFNS